MSTWTSYKAQFCSRPLATVCVSCCGKCQCIHCFAFAGSSLSEPISVTFRHRSAERAGLNCHFKRSGRLPHFFRVISPIAQQTRKWVLAEEESTIMWRGESLPSFISFSPFVPFNWNWAQKSGRAGRAFFLPSLMIRDERSRFPGRSCMPIRIMQWKAHPIIPTSSPVPASTRFIFSSCSAFVLHVIIVKCHESSAKSNKIGGTGGIPKK